MASPVDILEIESELIALLQAAGLPDNPAILAAKDIKGDLNAQVTPAVHVLLHEYGPAPGGQSRGLTGTPQIVYQRWLTTVAVRMPDRGNTGQRARLQAGPISAAVFSAVAGWQPSSKLWTPLRLAQAAHQPIYLEGGLALFPWAWHTEGTLK